MYLWVLLRCLFGLGLARAKCYWKRMLGLPTKLTSSQKACQVQNGNDAVFGPGMSAGLHYCHYTYYTRATCDRVVLSTSGPARS